MKNIKPIPSFVTEKNKYKLWSMGYDDWFISHMKYNEYQKILMGDLDFSGYIDKLSERLSVDEMKPIFELVGKKYEKELDDIEINNEILKNYNIISLN